MKLTIQVVLLLLFSSDATSFSRNPYLQILVLFLIVILNLQSVLRATSSYLKLLAILFTYFIIVIIFGKFFNRYLTVEIIITAVAGYSLYKTYGFLFILRLSQVIVIFTSIAMGFYVLDVVFGSALNRIIESADLGKMTSPNILVYTTHHTQIDAIFPRNAGFAYEPGPFSVFCVLGLILERVTRTDFDFFSKRSLILTLGIITSRSTTGLLLFLVFVFISSSENLNRVNRFLFYIGFGILSYLLFMNITFLGKKVEREYNQDYEQLITLAESSNSQVALGRFGSMMYEYKRFIQNPYLGNQGMSENEGTKGNNKLIGSVNAVGIIFSRFGFLGAMIVFFGAWRLKDIYFLFPNRDKDKMFFFWFIIAGFGFTIVLEPLVLILLVFGYFVKKS